MKKRIMLILPLLLTSCGAEYHNRMACRSAVGPEPYAAGAYFGAIGAIAMVSHPEHQEWRHRVDDCVAVRRSMSEAAR